MAAAQIYHPKLMHPALQKIWLTISLVVSQLWLEFL